jgi:8-oxo-dGTP pyrophosphatase MutT (NUDIX family)
VSEGEYEVLSSQSQFDGHIISVRTDQVRMSDGSISTREVVDHPGAVAVVALDDHDRIAIVRQYRHPIGAYLLELPAGLLDVENEVPLAAAQRELYEEAALRAARWDLLVDLLSSPGFSTEAVRVYLARDLTEVAPDDRYRPEHEELTLTVAWYPLAEAVELAFTGQLRNATAVAGVLATDVAHSHGWRDLRSAHSPWPAAAGH